MINITDDTIEFAKDFITKEEHFLEEATLNALTDGFYETSYWWSSSFFPNSSFRDAVGVALENWFHEHGYWCHVMKNNMSETWALRVIWNWEEEDKA
jgi:hypothetical protein